MKYLITAATLGLLFASTAFAQEDDTRAEIRELRQKLERLERKLAAEDAARLGTLYSRFSSKPTRFLRRSGRQKDLGAF